MFRNNMITILMPVEPDNIEKSEIFDIRITTAARGSGEKAIRRLKHELTVTPLIDKLPNKIWMFDTIGRISGADKFLGED